MWWSLSIHGNNSTRVSLPNPGMVGVEKEAKPTIIDIEKVEFLQSARTPATKTHYIFDFKGGWLADGYVVVTEDACYFITIWRIKPKDQ